MRGIVYAFILLAFIGLPVSLALGEAGNDSVTITVSATPEIAPPRPPPLSGVGVPPTRVLTVDMLDGITRVKIRSDGTLLESYLMADPSGNVILELDSGTKVVCSGNRVPERLEVRLSEEPPPLPQRMVAVSPVYDFIAYTSGGVPRPVTFDPPIRLQISYEPSHIPEDSDEEDLVIAYYDRSVGQWVNLESVVDTETKIIMARISHFTSLAVLAYKVIVPPAIFECITLNISPTEVDIGETVNIAVLVTNTGGEAGNYKVILKINGLVEGGKDVALNPDASKQVSFSTSKNTAGTYSVAVNGLIGSFIVKQKSPVPAKPINWPVVGGIIAGVVGLLVFFWMRRRAA